MSLLSRRFKPALYIVLAIITLLAIPVPWSTPGPWNVIAPAPVWAGSPDETLHPPTLPPVPPKKSAYLVRDRDYTPIRVNPAVGGAKGPASAFSTGNFLHVLWRVYLAMAVRY